MGIKKEEPESVEFGEFETSHESENTVVQKCDSGYVMDSLRTKCVDINECINPNICDSDRACYNIPGSYACDCRIGFKNVHNKCLDVNECSFMKGGCSHICENFRGSFRCTCPENMTLTSDDLTCFEGYHKPEIVNDFTTAENSCDRGYQYNDGVCVGNSIFSFIWSLSSNFFITDKDECALMESECGEEQMCLNTEGSYVCIPTYCPSEYETQDDM